MINKGPIFLSAGVPYPDPQRNPDGNIYSIQATLVREAIRGLVSAVALERRIVFGGQPAVTGFVWDAANSLDAQDSVTIYQSNFFRNRTPPQARFFKNLIWTPNDPDLNEALKMMRSQMIVKRSLVPDGPASFPEYDAAVFIGGLDGVEREWELFRQQYPRARVFPIGSTGGAAVRLLTIGPWQQALQASPQITWHGQPPNSRDLLEELRYRQLFRSLLN